MTPESWDEEERDEPLSGQLSGHAHSMAGIPEDARRLGLDRNTHEGALVAMAGSLDSAKLSHRIVAWILLAAFVVPLAFGTVHRLF